MDLEGSKVYLQPWETVLDVINDIVELQNGKLTFSDSPHGKVSFMISMYGIKWKIKFAVEGIGQNQCSVKLEVGGEPAGRDRMMAREFALLDSAFAEIKNG